MTEWCLFWSFKSSILSSDSEIHLAQCYHGGFGRTSADFLDRRLVAFQSFSDKIASANSHNNIYLSSRCQVTHAFGVTAFGCVITADTKGTGTWALMYGFLSNSPTHFWKGWASPGDKVTPVLLLSRTAESQVYQWSWESCMGILWESELYTDSSDTQSAVCVCACAGPDDSGLEYNTLVPMCVLALSVAQISVCPCCLSLSLSLSFSLAPSFIRTRRPGRKCFWSNSTQEFFILGTEVLEGVFSLEQRVSGWGEPVRHQHCQTDETVLSPYGKIAIKTGTNEQDIQYEILWW